MMSYRNDFNKELEARQGKRNRLKRAADEANGIDGTGHRRKARAGPGTRLKRMFHGAMPPGITASGPSGLSARYTEVIYIIDKNSTQS